MTTSALLVIDVQQVLFDPASRCARRCRIGWTRVAGLGYAISLVADAHTTRDKPHAPTIAALASARRPISYSQAWPSSGAAAWRRTAIGPSVATAVSCAASRTNSEPA